MRTLFSTLLYEQPLGDPDLLEMLEESCLQLAEDDMAGRRWCRENHYRGYTSYASLDDLPIRDPNFADLKRLLDKHVASFAKACAFDLGGKKLKLDSLWVNVLDGKGGHGAHIHPHSVVSGTLYVALPKGARGLKLEDPRLAMMMAAPTRLEDAPEGLRSFVEILPEPGTVLLWESWLRHEVPPGSGKEERISISFNYRWG
ncbi:TIGR02466 family protein [Sphingomonas sp. HITSZ_GF]|uniref:TIGR02466 family protein n=1 Tax=Sphingomonas sp. HITSZ_GF TaxID=3037247 RepID=UPI00240E6D09|nr:TIGR02466 family protein [Sphingomonas sp. HITSZ_GF]MDG2535514.1 TIGR02466 family protein [Sphingomonas sp. HITSZ_GF]